MTSLMTMSTMTRSNDVITCRSDQVSDTQTFAVDSQRLRSIRIWHAFKVCIILTIILIAIHRDTKNDRIVAGQCASLLYIWIKLCI